ncbi:MAG: IS66 family transposase [Lachnospiraceae bacterium]|nr:IS66 family transposase [Lachnospiraceae bacterium]MDY2759297.1 IS66 family transposase [Lachnospiraceae bacterium]
MEKTTVSAEQLNSLSKDALMILCVQLSQTQSALLEQNKKLTEKIEDLTEQIAILNQNRFGKHSEAAKQIEGQLSFNDFGVDILNEAESATESGIGDEKDITEVVVAAHKRKVGTRKKNLENVERETIVHDCTKEELDERFPGGWHFVNEDVYSELTVIPAKFKVLEHHIRVYAGNHDGDGMMRADSPDRMLPHSILTPELFSVIFNAKYVNALPLNRISEEFRRHDVILPRQDMAGWLIRIHEYYLEPVHTYMKKRLMESGLLHCDETPFVMPEHSKEYMWVLHSPGRDKGPPIFMYEYLGGRNGSVIQEYLKGYKGILVTDGYQPYHTIMKYSDDIIVAGCWAHTRRMYTEIVKAAKKDGPLTPAQKIAAEAVKRIDQIYHNDNKTKGSSDEVRLKNRKEKIKPLVDDFFAWAKTFDDKTISSTKLRKALNYSENQEPYLRTFLEHPEVPLDNNDAEASIRKFCVGKHSWHIIDSVNGAKASAFYYSIAETAKANGLKPYGYMRYLISELIRYPRGSVPDEELEALMPWSDSLPEICYKK